MVATGDKPLRWMTGTLQTPPVGRGARIDAGVLLRRLQRGESLSMPDARAMPALGPRVLELQVDDKEARVRWRILCRVDEDAVVVAHWFAKKTRTTPRAAIRTCQRRIREYDRG